MSNYRVGEVKFARIVNDKPILVELGSSERMEALRASYRREPIRGGLYMYAPPTPYRDGVLVAWEDVLWDIGDERVTAKAWDNPNEAIRKAE